MTSKKKQTVGYRYFLGMHLAVCHGPVDRLLAVFVDKRKAWLGDQKNNGTINISAEGLFGGEEREGGVSGALDVEMGGPAQTANSYLVSQLGSEVPGYRGIFGAVLKKMYVGMNPYLKPWSFVVQRVYKRQNGVDQWYAATAGIFNPAASNGGFNAAFEEEFETLGAYSTESGNGALYGVSGGTLFAPSQNAGTQARIKRTIPEVEFTRVSLKVQLPLIGAATDDACLFELMNGSTVIFTVNPMREQAFDNQRRPRFYYDGDDNFMGTALTPSTWYRFVWELNQDNGEWTASFIRDSDGAVHASVSGTGVPVSTANALRFTVDAGGATVSTQYRDIAVFTGNGGVGVDMNPAHIIRECLTDPDWGMGYAEGDIDDVSFAAAADTLYAEQMGISLLWDRQTPLEDFIKEILKHIDGTVYVSRQTGKFVLKLIRNDYSEAGLLVLDESNVEKVENYTERRFDEMVNSVTVKYTDAASWRDATIEVQDTAQVHMQNAVIGTTVSYPGFMHAGIAARVGARDLKTLSTPLATATLYASTVAKDLNIGDVFKFTWPDYQVQDLVMRVTAISFGDGKDNTVKVSCTQDSFALPTTEYVSTDPGEWVDPSGPPQPVAAQVFFEAPYYELARLQGQSTTDAELAEEPDRGYLGAAAVPPASGAINALLQTDVGAGFNIVGSAFDFAPSAVTTAALAIDGTSVAVAQPYATDAVVIGSYAQIDDEYVLVDAYDGAVLTLKRGVLDTVPAAHASGARIFFWPSSDAFGFDPTEYVSGETVDAAVLPTTGQGTLPLADAAIGSVVMNKRALRPYPPGDVKVNGEYYPATVTGDVAVTWVHRDRKQQTGGALLHFKSAGVGPESGTRYNARLKNAATNAILAQQNDIDGLAATLTANFAGVAKLELESVRDGLTSWQKHVISFDMAGGDALLTETQGALLLENGELLTIDAAPAVGGFGWILRQEAAAVRAGNRQVIFFRFGGSPNDAYWNPPKPQAFTILAQLLPAPGVPANSVSARCDLPTIVTGGFATEYPYVHERLAFLVSDAGAPSDIGFQKAAENAGVDAYAYKKNAGGAPGYPSDWCGDFVSTPGASGYDYCLVFPTGEVAKWWQNPSGPTPASAGQWSVLLATSPGYPIASSLRLDVLAAGGFEDKVTTARGRSIGVYFYDAPVEWASYRIILGGVAFAYTAKPGDDMDDVKAALAALVEAHASYTADATLPPYINITGPAPTQYTVDVDVVRRQDMPEHNMRILAAVGSTVYAVSDTTIASTAANYYVSTDGGKTYTQTDNNGAIPSYQTGVLSLNAVLSDNRYISIGLNETANIAGQITGDLDTLATVDPVRLQNSVSGSFPTDGYPRTDGGAVLAAGALWSDGTYFYAVGRLAQQTQPAGNMYLYRAGADGVFTLQGQLQQQAGDPNEIPSGQFGAFRSFWFCPNSTTTSIYNSRSKLKKIGSRWWLVSTLAAYYTDASDGLTGWKRAPLGFGEETRSNPPASIQDVVDCGGGLLFATDGSANVALNDVAVSTDSGDTWSSYKPTAFTITDSPRTSVFFDGKMLTYLDDGVTVAVGVSPYAAGNWTKQTLTGLPPGGGLVDIRAGASRLYGTAADRVAVYSDNGVAWDAAVLLKL